MNLRKKVFFILDRLKGGKLVAHINDIRNNQFDNNDQLRNLLKHAIKTTGYYQHCKGKKLEDFPVVSKAIIKANYNLFISNKFDSKSLNVVTTSGSTGTPFSVSQDKNKKLRNTADTIVFGKKAGYNIGEKLYYLKIWSKANHKTELLKFTQNIVTEDVLLMDNQRIRKLLNQWKKESKPFGIIGYASALESICKYLVQQNIQSFKCNVNSIITISETLAEDVKKKLSLIMGVPVISRYSNVENGILAQQDQGSEFEVNTASYKVEILSFKNDDRLEYGQFGRIVITDLYNFGMPLIRYDTGDLGSLIEKNKKLYFSTISGRKLDVLYNTKGQLVNSLLVYRNMWQYTELDQYQLIQISPSAYQIKVTSKNKFKRHRKLINEFKSYLGQDAEIKIIEVDEIPLLSSGKRRKVIQEFYK